jgi:predicted dehydrogenase
MKFLIAGLGSIGRRHFRNLIALGEKDIVLLRTRKATLPDDELAGYPVETELQEALQKHNPDAVIVANPTSMHLDVAIPAVEAGCHILLEKPISHSLERLDILQKAAEKSGSRILVGFQFRFHPTLNRARELIQSNALGKILTVHAHWGEYLPQWHPWEDYRQSYAARSDLGGGVIVTLTHPLDYLRYLLGDIETLWSFNGHISLLEIDVEDVAEIGLKFTNGAVGGVHVNYFQRPPVHRLEIVGTNGTFHWDNADGTLQHSVPTQTTHLPPLWKHFLRPRASNGTSSSSHKRVILSKSFAGRLNQSAVLKTESRRCVWRWLRINLRKPVERSN